jgi:hypothetical protein
VNNFVDNFLINDFFLNRNITLNTYNHREMRKIYNVMGYIKGEIEEGTIYIYIFLYNQLFNFFI